ncbi:hypothetical protein COY26_03340 [Candidatus Woesearchaeota archaeon CG_4_10_14_0_2_um_filter_33_10]|nr:MAG: hypothetical protein COY26_03340 [Candidatus Woesearchaeota archaeon CG_4_10_14_0_2_um_filter_33_10]
MRKYVNKKDKHTGEETDYSSGKPITKYFYLCCDICEVRDNKIQVDELTKEEGFPTDGDYCWNCQASMYEQEFIGKDKTKYFWREDY